MRCGMRDTCNHSARGGGRCERGGGGRRGEEEEEEEAEVAEPATDADDFQLQLSSTNKAGYAGVSETRFGRFEAGVCLAAGQHTWAALPRREPPLYASCAVTGCREGVAAAEEEGRRRRARRRTTSVSMELELVRSSSSSGYLGVTASTRQVLRHARTATQRKIRAWAITRRRSRLLHVARYKAETAAAKHAGGARARGGGCRGRGGGARRGGRGEEEGDARIGRQAGTALRAPRDGLSPREAKV